MGVAITINDVIRVYYNQLSDFYNKQQEFFLSLENEESDNESSTVVIDENTTVKYEEKEESFTLEPKDDPFDIHKTFKFKNLDQFEDFINHDYNFSLYARSPLTYNEVVLDYQKLYTEIVKRGELFTMISQENNLQKAGTFSFLSVNKVLPNKLHFYGNFSKIWESFDTIITANPYILKTKPQGCVSVKVKQPYNVDIKSDIEIDKIGDLINIF